MAACHMEGRFAIGSGISRICDAVLEQAEHMLL